MKLEFKGLITKEEFSKDSSIVDETLSNNDYAIIVDEGIGKYVVFDIDFVTNNLNYNLNLNEITHSYSLVESMIQALEKIPSKKTTAIKLATLVEDYYGREASPVTIRTRAEENANGKNEIDYFLIEPNNYIGLNEGITFETYMINKIKRGLKIRLDRHFKNNDKLEVTEAFSMINTLLKSKMYYGYYNNQSTGQYFALITDNEEFELSKNDYFRVKEEYKHLYY